MMTPLKLSKILQLGSVLQLVNLTNHTDLANSQVISEAASSSDLNQTDTPNNVNKTLKIF